MHWRSPLGNLGMPDISDSKVLVRPAVLEDAECLSALAFRSKAYWGYSHDFMEACREELRYTQADIGSKGFLFAIAELSRTIVGFYAIKALSDNQFELEALFVEPAYIGQGIGRMLIEHAKQTAKKLGGDRLVIQSDPHAVGFYQAAGGVSIGDRESASISDRLLPMLAIPLNENTTVTDGHSYELPSIHSLNRVTGTPQ